MSFFDFLDPGKIIGGIGQVLGLGGASALGAAATAQRIPGQTQAGEYTPAEGGFGTYNYIPTGATQIDPQLIQMILGGSGNYSNVMGNVNQYGNQLLQQGMTNPFAGLTAGMGDRAMNYVGAMDRQGATLDQNSLTPLNTSNNVLSQSQQLLQQAQGNPFTSSFISNTAGIGNNAMSGGADLMGAGSGALGGASNIVGQLSNNPFLQQAQQGANTAGGMLSNAGQNQYGMGQTFTGQVAAGMPAASQILNTAFDPQNQLYNRTLGQTQDQIGTLLARTGTTDSGTGAKFASDALNNFNIDWQNNQLGRQTQGLNSYNAGMTSTGNQLQQGAGMQQQGAQNYGAGQMLPAQTYQDLGAMQLGNYTQLGNLLGQTGNAMQAGANLGYQGAGAGYNANMSSLGDLMPFLNAYSGAGNSVQNALTGLGNNANTMGNIGTGTLNLNTAPYNFYNTQQQNQNTALTNYLANQMSGANMGNQNIGQLQNYLNSVMSGSANASNAANGAQSNTVSQNANAAAGAGSMIQGGFDALSSLFSRGGGGGGSAGTFGSWTPSYNSTRTANGW